MANLPAPRKKTRVREVPGAALPVPWALPSSSCTSYEATYKQGIITVRDHKQASALWHNGYFGHGFISGRKQRTKKQWKLVEAEGLKSNRWFKETHDAIKKKSSDSRGKKMGEEKKENERMSASQFFSEQGCSSMDMREKEKEETEESDDMSAEEYSPTLDEEGKPWGTVLVLSGDTEKSRDQSDPLACLTLLPEEALFLSYALGCLVVSKEEPLPRRQKGKRTYKEESSTHEMTIDEMWWVFVKDDPAFPIKYAVYHHYRTQGWVVKSGLKYGADWVLYPVGPPFYHSQYAVRVHSVWADTLTVDQTMPGHELSWTTIATTERLSNHVNKTPIMCFVLRPRSLTDDRLGQIECVQQLKVQEVLMARWNPNETEG